MFCPEASFLGYSRMHAQSRGAQQTFADLIRRWCRPRLHCCCACRQACSACVHILCSKGCCIDRPHVAAVCAGGRAVRAVRFGDDSGNPVEHLLRCHTRSEPHHRPRAHQLPTYCELPLCRSCCVQHVHGGIQATGLVHGWLAGWAHDPCGCCTAHVLLMLEDRTYDCKQVQGSGFSNPKSCRQCPDLLLTSC